MKTITRTSDAHRERALADVLSPRRKHGGAAVPSFTDATVETGSDGVCIVRLTMAELDWLTIKARKGCEHKCEYDEDDVAYIEATAERRGRRKALAEVRALGGDAA